MAKRKIQTLRQRNSTRIEAALEELLDLNYLPRDETYFGEAKYWAMPEELPEEMRGVLKRYFLGKELVKGK